MNNDEKWTYNLESDGQGTWIHDVFETKEEAIKEGLVKRTDKIAQNTQASNTTSTKGFATQPTQSTKKFTF